MTTTDIQQVDVGALEFVTGILSELTMDLGGEPADPDSELGSLGLESISLVYLIAEVQLAFSLGDALIRALRADVGTALPQQTVAQFATIVSRTMAEVSRTDGAAR